MAESEQEQAIIDRIAYWDACWKATLARWEAKDKARRDWEEWLTRGASLRLESLRLQARVTRALRAGNTTTELIDALQDNRFAMQEHENNRPTPWPEMPQW